MMVLRHPGSNINSVTDRSSIDDYPSENNRGSISQRMLMSDRNKNNVAHQPGAVADPQPFSIITDA